MAVGTRFGMEELGEQSSALPDMLMKIADTYDKEVDNTVSAMMSLLEPVFCCTSSAGAGEIFCLGRNNTIKTHWQVCGLSIVKVEGIAEGNETGERDPIQ